MSSESLLSPEANSCPSAIMWQATPGDLSLWSQKGNVPLCQLGWSSRRGLEEGTCDLGNPAFTSLVTLLVICVLG